MIVQRMAAAVCAAAALLAAAPAGAQGADPNTGALTLSGGFDVANAYHFRGIPQDEGNVGSVMWPSADLGIALHDGTGAMPSLAVNVGTWNSLHTGGTGLDGPSGKLWYESDFYATLGIEVGGGTTVGVTYTAYTSPNGMFSTVKEVAVRVGVDDGGWLGGAAVRPYALVAIELDTQPSVGQADGGIEGGRYLEVGAAPGLSAGRMGIAVPVKVGLSLANYYEGADGDERFGFFSVAGVVAVPFSAGPTRFGTWNVHGGVEYLRLGDRNQQFGESQVIGTVGVGFSY